MPPPAGLEPVDYIRQAREEYGAYGYEPYRWATNPEPCSRVWPRWPVEKSRVVLVASGGIYRRGQVAFHYRDDTSYRRVPKETAARDLRIAHFGYDIRDAVRDPGIVFPLDALRALERDGRIGALCPNALTFMGGIYSQRRVKSELIPRISGEVHSMGAEVAILVPVCPVCHQSAGLIARALEQEGVATVCLTTAWHITARANPPRAAFLDFPIGHTSGRPGRFREQAEIMRDVVALFGTDKEPDPIETLPYAWGEDWKRTKAADDYEWPGRNDWPQYQYSEDREAAVRRFGRQAACHASDPEDVPAD